MRSRPLTTIAALPGQVLSLIIGLVIAADSQKPSTYSAPLVSLLRVSKTFHRVGLPLVYAHGHVGLDRLASATLLGLLCTLDPAFSQRVHSHHLLLMSSSDPQQSWTPPPQEHYPFSPANVFPSAAARPPFRAYIRRLSLASPWDGNFPTLSQIARRGQVPLAWVPIILEVARWVFPQLESLELVLPRKLLVSGGPPCGQACVDALGESVIRAISKYGLLQSISLEAWTLNRDQLCALLQSLSSLRVLLLSQAPFDLWLRPPCAPLYRLRRLTLIDSTLEAAAIPNLLSQCTELISLQLSTHLTGLTSSNLEEIISSFPPRSHSSPIVSLVLRLSYRTKPLPDVEARLVFLTALLHSLSTTLERLHLPIQLATTPHLYVLLSPVFASLTKLHIGFLEAEAEVGHGVRLSSPADERRLRPGLKRGHLVHGDVDPFNTDTESRVRGETMTTSPGRWTTTAGTGRASRVLSNQRAIVLRLGLDQAVLKAVMTGEDTEWIRFSSGWKDWKALLARFESLQDIASEAQAAICRGRELSELMMFETDFVAGYWEMVNRVYAEGAIPSGSSRVAKTAWDRFLDAP